jgi:hypothetical protein
MWKKRSCDYACWMTQNGAGSFSCFHAPFFLILQGKGGSTIRKARAFRLEQAVVLMSTPDDLLLEAVLILIC